MIIRPVEYFHPNGICMTIMEGVSKRKPLLLMAEFNQMRRINGVFFDNHVSGTRPAVTPEQP